MAMSAVPVRRAGLASGVVNLAQHGSRRRPGDVGHTAAAGGLASGVVNLARLVGITVGVAVLGSAMAAVERRKASAC